MNDKKYIGQGKETQYSINCELDLIQIFEQISPKAAETIKKMIQGAVDKLGFYANIEKGQLKVKVQVTKRKEVGQYGDTHYVTLNEWKPEAKPAQKQEEKQEEESDDLPF